MPAPKGNQYWKNRAKHGRDKLFESPELLWEAACEYFQWCDDNPWTSTETTTKDLMLKSETTVKEKPTQRPYTIEGFRLYVKASSSWYREFKKTCQDEDFLSVLDEIETVITQNQLEGATVGVFNASIIARKLGLTEKTENVNINRQGKPLTDEEIDALNKKLEDDY